MRPNWMVVAAGFIACGHATNPSPAGDVGDASVADAAASMVGMPDAFVPQDAPIAYDCAPTATAGHQTISCPMGVTMDVEISEACAAGGCGVIWDVPGYTMTADVQDTHTRMRTLAPPLGYIVVQPTTTGFWGTGQYNDVIWNFQLAVADRLHTDPDRLHVMGFSQGADLTYLMLCAHSDAIASIAPDSGNGCFGLGAGPPTIRPILYVQGTADNIQSWSIFGPPVRDAILASSDYGSGAMFSSSDAYMATRWTTSSGMDFEFWQHNFTDGSFLGGHCLPVPNGSGAFRCDNPEFDYSNEVLRFFGAHPRGH